MKRITLLIVLISVAVSSAFAHTVTENSVFNFTPSTKDVSELVDEINYKTSERLLFLTKIDRHTVVNYDSSTPPSSKYKTSQERAVKGVVTDESGTTLPGVNVIIKGTSKGTVTDFNGTYQIQVDNGDIIVFSYVGFVSQEVAYNGQTSVNITLVEDATQLKEVVVIGYGSARKEEITSAVVGVESEDFNQGNINSPIQLLQGKVAGLNTARVGGDPNQPFVIRLRGLSTFGANSEPLIVIDGIVGGSMDAVDPGDISSISVLKDASASAIYGTRGSSGVIIITTKSGSDSGSTKTTLEYSNYIAMESISNTIRVADKEEFIEHGGADLGANTNWLDEVSRNAMSFVNNISFSKSTPDGLNYRASVNYRDVDAVLKGRGFDQFNARINVSQRLLNDKLKLTAIVSFADRDADIGFSQALRYSLTFIPTAPVSEDRTAETLGRDPDLYGGFFETGVQDVFNPVALNTLNTRLEKRKNFSGNFRAEYEAIEGLKLSVNYSKQTSSSLRGEYFASNALFRGSSTKGSASRSLGESSTDIIELLAKYDFKIDDITFNALGGYSFQEINSEGFNSGNTKFITDKVSFNNLGLGLGIDDKEGSVGSYRSEAKLSAYFGRVSVNYDNFAFASASFRSEASSRFGDNNRRGNFYAVSAGVNLTDLFEIPSVNQLKVRAGYGVTGNEPRDFYPYLEKLGKTGSGYVDGSFVTAVGPTSNPNPDLKWEEKGEYNLGIDFEVLNSRLSGSLDYFTRNTTDLLNTIGVSSPPNLFSRTLVNLGELESKGFEAQINFSAIDRDDFSWDIGANISTVKTTLVRLTEKDSLVEFRGSLGPPGLNGIRPIRVAEGERLGQIRAAIFAGYNSDGETLMINQETGEATTERNLDRDGKIVGNGLPDFTFGFNNTIRYKNLDLNLFFRGVIGHSLVNIQRAYFEHPSLTGRQNIVTADINPDDTELDAYHSGYVEKASFLKLDNVTLGYNFDLPKKWALDKLRMYLSGNNLLTFTNYSGSDPEVRYSDPGPITEGNARRSYGGDILVPGIDRRVTYFPTRTITFGINVKF